MNNDLTDKSLPPPIRILVVDDQPIIRRGIALILDTEEDIEVIGMAADGIDALEMVEKYKPDIVLMDLHMPRLSGVAATRQIKEKYFNTRVIILTSFETGEMIYDAIRAGAHAYLLKDADENEILDTIRAIHRGEFRLNAAIASKVMSSFQSLPSLSSSAKVDTQNTVQTAPLEDETFSPSDLTPREQKILSLVSEGMSNKQIAQTIFLSEGTVKNYVSRIMEKLHAKTRTELAVKTMQRNKPMN